MAVTAIIPHLYMYIKNIKNNGNNPSPIHVQGCKIKMIKKNQDRNIKNIKNIKNNCIKHNCAKPIISITLPAIANSTKKASKQFQLSAKYLTRPKAENLMTA